MVTPVHNVATESFSAITAASNRASKPSPIATFVVSVAKRTFYVVNIIGMAFQTGVAMKRAIHSSPPSADDMKRVRAIAESL